MSTPPNSIPKWREDFPIEQGFDDVITRRDFVRFLGLVSAGLMVGSGSLLVRSLTQEEGPFPRIEIPGANKLAPGEWLVFSYPDKRTPAMLVRRENGTFISFQQKCPHLACPVSYHKSEEGEGECLRCHCHNGKFDLNSGHGTQGPPRELRPLRQVTLEHHEGVVVATGLNEIRIA